MLNKDQYNEDAYNDYYAQAAQGAEIKDGPKEGGKSKLLLIFLLLALISTLGYFVWENLASIKKNEISSSIVQDKVNTQEESSSESIETKRTVEEGVEESLESALEKTLELAEKEEKSLIKNETPSSDTAKIVANITSQTSDDKMSPADIARIVQLVTQQMQTEKKTEEKEILNNKKEKDSLEASLENVETDTLSSESPILAYTDGSQKKEASSENKNNTYNKVILEKSPTDDNTTDELSQLSMEISNVINSDTDLTPTTSTYTSSLSKEANARSKEMRYHIVKKGDTLAGIALKIYGSTKDYIKLHEANPDILRRADKIYIGQRLRVPE